MDERRASNSTGLVRLTDEHQRLLVRDRRADLELACVTTLGLMARSVAHRHHQGPTEGPGENARAEEEDEGAGADEITAPMPGQITRLLVAVGDEIRKGQDVAIIEAMKMENVLSSEAGGTVRSIEVAVGDNLNVDDLIMSLDLVGDD